MYQERGHCKLSQLSGLRQALKHLLNYIIQLSATERNRNHQLQLSVTVLQEQNRSTGFDLILCPGIEETEEKATLMWATYSP